MKKTFKIIGLFIFVGFSFFYTEKVTNVLKNKDPIMIKINKEKKEKYIEVIKPIINNDEYIMGINGCKVDVNKSYNKMKTVKEYKKELLVMKEVKNNYNLKNKYIVGANRLNKNVSIIFLVKDDINTDLVNYLSNKNIRANFFIDHNFLENNSITIKFLSKNNNVYYLGNNMKYNDKYMIYANNLIEMNSNNRSNYCLVENKDDDTLKLCSLYNMKTIKVNLVKDNLIENVKNDLINGAIITIDSDEINKIKVLINYIISKGYNIVSLEDLLNENKCNK